jgi:transcriptional regulator with XRE-family HTH domain
MAGDRDAGGEVLFRDWLARELRARRMSLRQLAGRSGVNASTISRILRGERRPTLHTAVRIARAVEGTADETTATRFFGVRHEETDPVANVERALRADADLEDPGVRRVMSLYLNLRRDSNGVRRIG